MFHFWTLLPAIYLGWRLVYPLQISWQSKCLIFILLATVADFHLLSRVIFGTMFSPELPQLVMIFLGWGFGFIVLLFALLVLRDVSWIAYYLITRKRLSTLKSGAVLTAMATILSGIGVYESMKLPDVRKIDVAIAGLPKEYEGYKVVQLTDLHVSRLLTGEWLNKVVKKTNSLNADLILVTGDMIDGTVEARRNDVSSFAFLRAHDGIYAVTGNHEYYFDAREWTTHLSGLGLRFLNNEHVVLSKNGARLILAGITDDVATEYGGTKPNLMSALSGIPPSDKVILMSHRPGNAQRSAEAGVSLQLSGHTHGGMVYGLDKIVAPANNGYVSGFYQVGSMSLYVSNGTGLWNGFPLRLGKPSEITALVLHSK